MKKLITLLLVLSGMMVHGQRGVEVAKGIILDTLTTAELNSLPNPVKRKGAYFHNRDTGALVTWNGNAWVSATGPGGGASQLSDLTDVGTTTPTNRNVLVADGTSFQSRPLVEADVSNLSHTVDTDDQNLSEVLAQGNDAGGVKIVNLADPTLAQDAATKAYVDANAGSVTLDAVPTNGSTNGVESNGVFDALAAKASIDPNSPNSPLFFLGTNAELLTAYPSFPTGAPTNLVVFKEDGTLDATDVSYDNSTSGTAGNNLQNVVDEIETRVDANDAKVSNATHTGDVTGSTVLTIATGAVAADELASTTVTPGSYTNADITVDADGRITAAANGSSVATATYFLKENVKVATTSNIALSGALTIDGNVLEDNDRVLVKNQTDQSQNGIYVVNTLGAWSRSTDADSDVEIARSLVYVRAGSLNADKFYQTDALANISLGVDNLTFSEVDPYSAGIPFMSSSTISDGSTATVPYVLYVEGDALRKYALQKIQTGAASTFTIDTFANEPIPQGTSFLVRNNDDDPLTLDPVAGVSIIGPNGADLGDGVAYQVPANSTGILTVTGTNQWTFQNTGEYSASGLASTDIDTFAELNTIVADETLSKAGDNVSSFTNDAGYITSQTDDQTATEVPFTPYSTITSTNTQAAVQELKDEVDAKAGVDPNSPNSPLFFLGTNAELLTAYPSFPTGAPANLVVFEEDGTLASSDVSYDNSTSGLTATNVKTAIDELAASSTSDVEAIQIACSDLTTDITTGTTKAYFRMPYAMTLTDVRVSLLTAGTTTGITVDINESGVSVLSTLLTTDATEKTSETATTPAVISDSALADDAEITIDFDAVPTSGQGVIVTLIGTRI